MKNIRKEGILKLVPI